MLRATLKGMLSRKLRLALSTLAALLGVMFVAGAFVLTDTLGRSFQGLFTTIYENVDIQVTQQTEAVSVTGRPVQANITADRVPIVEAVPGVADAHGGVFVDGAKLVGPDGKVVPTTGSPRFGGAWTDGADGFVAIRDGNAPTADDEVMLSANLATKTGYGIGDSVEILTALAPAKRPYTVVGIAGYASGRDSLAGETFIFFTESVAQQVMLGEPGVFSEISVDVEPGTDLTVVRDRIAAALGDEYTVLTGTELAAANTDALKEGLRFINYLLLGFAGISLFVGVFIIINTFSITVAQRTRELALLRAIGAVRGQVIRSVLVEAVVIGVVASAVGLLAGIGIGVLMAIGVGSFLSGGNLPLAGIGVPPLAIISAVVVGLGVTMLAALLPAIRASRIAPVAAMRDAAIPDRPLRPLTASGAGVLAVGGAALGLGLAGRLGDLNLWGVLGGVLTCFVGVALLTPLIARPVVAVLGRALSWGAAGKLGRSNSGRNPRRTAITAAALMVSVALVTGISVIVASIKASTIDALDAGIDAQLIVSADPSTLPVQIDPASLQTIRAMPDAQTVVGNSFDFGKANGRDAVVQAFDNLPGAVSLLRITATQGTLQPGPGELIVDDQAATDLGLQLGDTVALVLPRTAEQELRVAGIYERTPVVFGVVVPQAVAQAGFQYPAPSSAYVQLRPGSDQEAALARVRDAIAGSPEVNAYTVDEYVAASAQLFDLVLTIVQVLLALAMFIAVLGVINTLALSMIERTREVGMLRAVGMRRGQIMSMVTVESVVICVFGALLGIVVGTGLGIAVFQALREQGLTTLAFEWPLMAVYVVAAVIVGLVAAFFPALFSARQNVLRAIAYE